MLCSLSHNSLNKRNPKEMNDKNANHSNSKIPNFAVKLKIVNIKLELIFFLLSFQKQIWWKTYVCVSLFHFLSQNKFFFFILIFRTYKLYVEKSI